MSEQMPTVGRIVHYWTNPKVGYASKDPVCLPAVVTRVWNRDCVNLRVIADGMPDADARLTSVVRSDEPIVGFWRWPERV